MIHSDIEQLPLHIYTNEERETFEKIIALLKNGGKIIRINEWVNNQGGHYRTEIQNGDQLYVFELEICTPMIFGPSESWSPLK